MSSCDKSGICFSFVFSCSGIRLSCFQQVQFFSCPDVSTGEKVGTSPWAPLNTDWRWYIQETTPSSARIPDSVEFARPLWMYTLCAKNLWSVQLHILLLLRLLHPRLAPILRARRTRSSSSGPPPLCTRLMRRALSMGWARETSWKRGGKYLRNQSFQKDRKIDMFCIMIHKKWWRGSLWKSSSMIKRRYDMWRYEIVVILEGVIEQTGNTIQVGSIRPHITSNALHYHHTTYQTKTITQSWQTINCQKSLFRKFDCQNAKW